MWQQVKPFDQSKAGKTKNMCLANVRAGYQIKNILPDAWTAWEQTEQHTDTPPKGVDVPIFFSYIATIDGVRKNWGHIGVQLKNGKFWSDGITYANIAAYTANHSPKYVGWGESVNNETVIRKGGSVDNKKPVGHARANQIFKAVLLRGMTAAEFNKYHKGKTELELFEQARTSKEHKLLEAKLANSDSGKFKVLADKVKALMPFTK